MRKIDTIALGIVCIVACSAGLTVSYQTDSQVASNELHFVGSDALDAVLKEPSWDPEHAVLVVPNSTIAKDPQVTNTSGADLDELVALQLEFVYTAACPEEARRGTVLDESDMAFVAEVFEIDYNADTAGEWIRFEGEDKRDPVQHFYYHDVLERNYPEEGDTTAPLFTSLTVGKQIDNEQYAHIQAIGGFDIRISGCVLQQMEGEQVHGLGSPAAACEAGLFF